MMKKSILFINGADYTLGWGRSVNLAKAFASQGFDVFYSEYPRPILKERASISASQGFSVLRPSGLPIMRFQSLRGLNTKHQLRQLIRAMDKKNFRPDIIIICTVTDAIIAETIKQRYKPCIVIYDCADDRVGFAAPFITASHKERLDMMEKKLIAKSDVVLVVNDNLFHRVSAINKNVYHVSNGVDLNVFSMEAVKELPEELAEIPSPRIGYIGTLGHRTDQELLCWLTKERPQWSFVFVGPMEEPDLPIGDIGKNAYFLGSKPYSQMPAYIASFDVCIVPFRDCPSAVGSDPLKVLQYLAMAKPVVTTDFKGGNQYEDNVIVAETRLDFLTEIERQLQNNSELACKKRTSIAEKHSWQARTKEILGVLKTHNNEESLSNF